MKEAECRRLKISGQGTGCLLPRQRNRRGAADRGRRMGPQLPRRERGGARRRRIGEGRGLHQWCRVGPPGAGSWGRDFRRRFPEAPGFSMQADA